MSEQPVFKAKHDEESIDTSDLSVHHTLGTFRFQAAGGAHRHTKDDPSSLPLFEDRTFDAGNPIELWNALESLGATVTNKPDETWQPASLLNSFQNYNTTTWGPVQYRKANGFVQITGLVKRSGTTPSSETAIFILPADYAPESNHRKFLQQMKVSAMTLGGLNILRGSGEVVWSADNPSYSGITWLSMDMIFKI